MHNVIDAPESIRARTDFLWIFTNTYVGRVVCISDIDGLVSTTSWAISGSTVLQLITWSGSLLLFTVSVCPIDALSCKDTFTSSAVV